MNTPSHKGRCPDQILTEHVYHDAQGFAFRAASWIDWTRSSGQFTAFHYSCIDGRLAIEHLIFEQLVITAGENLDAAVYQRCVNEPRKLDKLLRGIVPEYEKLQDFTEIVATLMPSAPPINKWDIAELRKLWGKLSHYLHWSGAHPETTENLQWQHTAIEEVADIVEPIWEKISIGHSGCMPPESMAPHTREVWEEFKADRISRECARERLSSAPNSDERDKNV